MKVWHPACCKSISIGEVMKQVANSWNARYAVIEARAEGRPERFVIAYPDESTLRDLLAASSIIASGFNSREAALASIEGCSSVVAA
jgi:hypothetical protein